MIYDKKQGSLLNYIQMPLNVITPDGTYLGVGYADGKNPQYVLSPIRVKTFYPSELIFSDLSKNLLIKENKPTLKMNNSLVLGYGYKVSEIEIKIGYITVESKRIYINDGRITIADANFLLEKQLRHIGNVIRDNILVQLGQPQWDALLVHYFYEGVDTIEDSPITILLNREDYFLITDAIQTGMKFSNGRVDESLAKRRMSIARMFSHVPGF